jgi:hypothetical protein
MKDITLNKQEFKLFNQDDQFGFFYDDWGFSKDNADETFESDVDKLYMQFDAIIVSPNDNIFGLKEGKKELYLEGLIEAYDIAREVKED